MLALLLGHRIGRARGFASCSNCMGQGGRGERRNKGEEEELISMLTNAMGSRAPHNNPRRRNMEEGAPYSARRHLECAGGGTKDRLMSGE